MSFARPGGVVGKVLGNPSAIPEQPAGLGYVALFVSRLVGLPTVRQLRPSADEH